MKWALILFGCLAFLLVVVMGAMLGAWIAFVSHAGMGY